MSLFSGGNDSSPIPVCCAKLSNAYRCDVDERGHRHAGECSAACQHGAARSSIDEMWQLNYATARERRWLGYSNKVRPFADCICVGCRAPSGWNRCAGDVPYVTTIYEHWAELERSFEGMAL